MQSNSFDFQLHNLSHMSTATSNNNAIIIIIAKGWLNGSKRDGEKVSKREKLPNRKLIGSKRVGEKIRGTGKFPN